MAAAGNRAKKQAPQEKPMKPELAAGPEPEPREAERAVTLEYLTTLIGEAVARAEEGKRKIEEVNAYIAKRVEDYGKELTMDERAKLGAIVAQAHARLRTLEQKAAEATGRAAAVPDLASLAERELRWQAEDSEEDAARAAGAVAGAEPQTATPATPEPTGVQSLHEQMADVQGAAERDRAPRAFEAFAQEVNAQELRYEHSELTAEQWREWLKAQLDTYDGSDPSLDAQRRMLLEKYEAIVEPGDIVEEQPAEARRDAAPELPIPMEEPRAMDAAAFDRASVTVDETAAPETAAETAPTLSVRGLLNAARIRRRIENPAELATALAQAKYAERRGITEHEALAGKLEAVVRAMSGSEQLKGGMAELQAIAAEVGVPAEQIEDIVARQHAALEDRARREVTAESQAGVTKVLAKGAGYTGYMAVGALLQRFTGAGWLVAPSRLVATWREGKVQERKVQQRIGDLEAQLAKADLAPAEAPLAHEVLGNIAAEIALLKQEQVNGTSDLSDTERQADALRQEVVQFLAETGLARTPEQQLQMARAAGALFAVDQATAVMELRASAQQPNIFRRMMTGMDKALSSKLVRGGASGKERALTAAVFATAGVLAREIPVLRNVLFAYTGMKAGEALAHGIVRHAGRYEVLKPVTAEQLAAADAPKDVIDRARAQLLDGKLRTERPAEYQRIREALDQHEARLYADAKRATDYVDERTTALEQALVRKTKIEHERTVLVNSARVVGAAAGWVLGPMAVEWGAKWIATKFGSPEAAAVPAAGAAAEPAPGPEGVPGPEAAGTTESVSPAPEVDPHVYELAMIRKDDGLTRVFLRQLEYQPQAFGFGGDPNNAAEVRAWAMGEAKRLAVDMKFLNPDGRVTEYGLKAGTGGIVLHPDGFELIGTPQAYEVHKALGFAPSAAEPGGSEVARAWEELEGPEAQAALAASNEALLREATERAGPMTAAERELDADFARAGSRGTAAEAPTGGAGKAEEWVRWEGEEAPPAETAHEATAARGSAPPEPTVGAGGIEVGHTPAWVSKFEDVFRGAHSTEERLTALRASLSGERIMRIDGGRMQFKLEEGAPVWSKNSGATFEAVDEKAIAAFVQRQQELDAAERDIMGSDIEFRAL